MKYQHLTQEQRYIIQYLLDLGKSKSFIAKEVGVHRSTVYREIESVIPTIKVLIMQQELIGVPVDAGLVFMITSAKSVVF